MFKSSQLLIIYKKLDQKLMAMINDLSNRLRSIIKSQDIPIKTIGNSKGNSRVQSVDSSPSKKPGQASQSNNKIKIPEKHYTLSNRNNPSAQGIRPPLTPNKKKPMVTSQHIERSQGREEQGRDSEHELINDEGNSHFKIDESLSPHGSFSIPSRHHATPEVKSEYQDSHNRLIKFSQKYSQILNAEEKNPVPHNGIKQYLQEEQIDFKKKNYSQSENTEHQPSRIMLNQSQKSKSPHPEVGFHQYQEEFLQKIKFQMMSLINPIINQMEKKMHMLKAFQQKIQTQLEKMGKKNNSKFQKMQNLFVSANKEIYEMKEKIQLIENQLDGEESSEQEELEDSKERLKTDSLDGYELRRKIQFLQESSNFRKSGHQSPKYKQRDGSVRQKTQNFESWQKIKQSRLPPKQSISRQSQALSNRIIVHIEDIAKQLQQKISELNEKFQLKIENILLREQKIEPFYKQQKCQCKHLVDQILKSQEHLAMQLKYVKHFQGLSRPYETHSSLRSSK